MSALEAFGDAADSPAAMASSARAILSSVSCLDDGGGRFVAAFGDLSEALRGPGFRGFFDMA
jgi:hypothetical protein